MPAVIDHENRVANRVARIGEGSHPRQNFFMVFIEMDTILDGQEVPPRLV